MPIPAADRRVGGNGEFGRIGCPDHRVYFVARPAYIGGNRSTETSEEAAMRAEIQKHADAIKDSLALLRRHL